MHFGYIYEIRNDLNGHTYVGKHKCSEGNDDYMGSGILLPPAYKKYGIEHFTKRIIQYSPTEEDLNRSEELWIDFYKRIGKAEYNIARGGYGGNTMKYASEEQRAERRIKQSEAWNYSKHFTEEVRKHMAEARMGNKYSPHSEETKRKIARALKGIHRSDETRKRMSESLKGNQRRKGCHQSEETRKRISELHKGKHWKVVDGKRVWY